MPAFLIWKSSMLPAVHRTLLLCVAVVPFSLGAVMSHSSLGTVLTWVSCLCQDGQIFLSTLSGYLEGTATLWLSQRIATFGAWGGDWNGQIEDGRSTTVLHVPVKLKIYLALIKCWQGHRIASPWVRMARYLFGEAVQLVLLGYPGKVHEMWHPLSWTPRWPWFDSFLPHAPV